MKDTRNWKCFFGMHQWQHLDVVKFEYFNGNNRNGLPYKITRRHTLKCCHCGEMKLVEM